MMAAAAAEVRFEDLRAKYESDSEDEPDVSPEAAQPAGSPPATNVGITPHAAAAPATQQATQPEGPEGSQGPQDGEDDEYEEGDDDEDWVDSDDDDDGLAAALEWADEREGEAGRRGSHAMRPADGCYWLYACNAQTPTNVLY